jgi:hypothetical protein
LIGIAQPPVGIIDRALSGLTRGDKVWGLACLSDGTLWTMASPRSVARVDERGQVRERIPVHLPRVAMFGAGDRLLFQQLPSPPGVSVLATSPPREPTAIRPWAGLTTRTVSTRADQLARNLTNCGIGSGRWMPCWFADDLRFTISDGRSARVVALNGLHTGTLDKEAPIWDVALTPSDYVWVLINLGGARDHRAGGRLVRAREGTSDVIAASLDPPARQILLASESRCLLLAADGSLVEVVAIP